MKLKICSIRNLNLYWTSVLVVVGDLNAVTGTERAGYKICVGPYGPGIRNDNSTLLPNHATSKKLRIESHDIRDQLCTSGLGIAMPE